MQRNIGIDLFKIIACYAVVLIHFGATVPLSDLAVPCFFFLAFYLSPKITNFDTLKNREIRLIIPFVVWGVCGFIVRSIHESSFRLDRLLLQLIFGQTCNSMLWFVSVLIFLTFVIFLIEQLRKYRTFVLIFSFFMCFLLQYSGHNFKFFHLIPAAMSMTLGRILEMCPYAIAGVCFRDVCQSVVSLVIGFMMLMCGICMRHYRFFEMSGFGYEGVPRFLCAVGLSIAMIIIGIKIGKYIPYYVSRIIVLCASLTPGIYFSHKIMGSFLVAYSNINADGVVMTILVFGLSGLMICVMKRVEMCRAFVK